MCILFAATYPQRTAALVLCESYANWLHDDENHWAPTRDQHEEVARLYERRWGEPVGISAFAPTMAKDGEFRRRFGTYSRMAASPGAAASLLRMNDEMDVRPVLPSVRVPTLVLHRRHDQIIDIEGWALFGSAHTGCSPGGVRRRRPPAVGRRQRRDRRRDRGVPHRYAPRSRTRVLATVLFSDIVASTERAAALGDQRWRELLDSHTAELARQLDRFQGRLVKWLGDGLLAVFDGPARAIRCGRALVDESRRLGVEIRVGLHAGECEVSTGPTVFSSQRGAV